MENRRVLVSDRHQDNGSTNNPDAEITGYVLAHARLETSGRPVPYNEDTVPAPKLIESLREYRASWLAGDLIAGVTVGLVALPLAMAFAIASGLPPQNGIYTAVVAGFVISALGGSRTQIGGPTGAFIVVIAGIVAVYGVWTACSCAR